MQASIPSPSVRRRLRLHLLGLKAPHTAIECLGFSSGSTTDDMQSSIAQSLGVADLSRASFSMKASDDQLEKVSILTVAMSFAKFLQ
jgi:hypothetical protein